MKEEMEKRIEELQENLEEKWASESFKRECREKLEIIENLYYAMY
jgi:hypothetical protein